MPFSIDPAHIWRRMWKRKYGPYLLIPAFLLATWTLCVIFLLAFLKLVKDTTDSGTKLPLLTDVATNEYFLNATAIFGLAALVFWLTMATIAEDDSEQEKGLSEHAGSIVHVGLRDFSLRIWLLFLFKIALGVLVTYGLVRIVDAWESVVIPWYAYVGFSLAGAWIFLTNLVGYASVVLDIDVTGYRWLEPNNHESHRTVQIDIRFNPHVPLDVEEMTLLFAGKEISPLGLTSFLPSKGEIRAISYMVPDPLCQETHAASIRAKIGRFRCQSNWFKIKPPITALPSG